MKKKTHSISQSDYEILADFRYALRKFLRFSENAAKAVGLTPQQHQALLAIKGFPKGAQVTVGQLAERLQLRHHSAVELVDRLVKQKYLERKQSRADRREVYLNLAPKGLRVLAALTEAHKVEIKQVGGELRALLQTIERNANPDLETGGERPCKMDLLDQ